MSDLCKICSGNGVLKLRFGVMTCETCGGRGWAGDMPNNSKINLSELETEANNIIHQVWYSKEGVVWMNPATALALIKVARAAKLYDGTMYDWEKLKEALKEIE